MALRFWSRPVRDAWIETAKPFTLLLTVNRRVPYGTRGLKPTQHVQVIDALRSRPVRDAWIETLKYSKRYEHI